MTFAGVLRRAWIPLVVLAVIGGAVADISYFDVDSAPRRVDGARLPWSIHITANSPAVVGNVLARATATALAAGSC